MLIYLELRTVVDSRYLGTLECTACSLDCSCAGSQGRHDRRLTKHTATPNFGHFYTCRRGIQRNLWDIFCTCPPQSESSQAPVSTRHVRSCSDKSTLTGSLLQMCPLSHSAPLQPPRPRRLCHASCSMLHAPSCSMSCSCSCSMSCSMLRALLAPSPRASLRTARSRRSRTISRAQLVFEVNETLLCTLHQSVDRHRARRPLAVAPAAHPP